MKIYIISTKQILNNTQHNNYTIPTFNIHNLKTIQIIIKTTTNLHTPIIITKTPDTFTHTNTKNLLTLINTITKQYHHPLTIHLNHHTKFNNITQKIHSNIHSIIINTSHLPFTQNISQIKKIINFYHHFNINIKTKLKQLNNQKNNIQINKTNTLYTNPTQTHKFTKTTKINSLTITINTTHKIYTNTPTLNFSKLKNIHQ